MAGGGVDVGVTLNNNSEVDAEVLRRDEDGTRDEDIIIVALPFGTVYHVPVVCEEVRCCFGVLQSVIGIAALTGAKGSPHLLRINHSRIQRTFACSHSTSSSIQIELHCCCTVIQRPPYSKLSCFVHTSSTVATRGIIVAAVGHTIIMYYRDYYCCMYGTKPSI